MYHYQKSYNIEFKNFSHEVPFFHTPERKYKLSVETSKAGIFIGLIAVQFGRSNLGYLKLKAGRVKVKLVLFCENAILMMKKLT